VVTDGYITAESDVFELIQTNLNRTNVFAFGIGSSVNRYLIEGMATAGQGGPFVVLGPDQARAQAELFRDYIAAPVLTDIQIDYDGFQTADVEPVSIPDLFAKRPVVVFGKWRGQPRGRITLTAADGSGPYQHTIDVADTAVSTVNSALPYLWARTRIARLSDFNIRRGATDHREAVTALGLKYNLLTAHTSFVAVHEVARNTGGKGQNVNQPLPLPHKVSELAVGGGAAAVPEPEIVLLAAMVGFLMLGMAMAKKRGMASGDRHLQ
jgi:Ca-activated chloride channel family protein